MTATDELRRLLDERGVEHGDVESAPYPPYNSTRRMTTFWANKCVWQYIEDEREGGDIELEGRYMSMSVTPEQAIAATLGGGTCKEVYLLMATDIGDGREEVLGAYTTESAAKKAISENQFGYAFHHVRKLEVTS